MKHDSVGRDFLHNPYAKFASALNQNPQTLRAWNISEWNRNVPAKRVNNSHGN